MVFESRDLSSSRMLLCLAFIGASIGLGFLLVGKDILRWVGLLLLAIPVILVSIVSLGRGDQCPDTGDSPSVPA
jgi:hypothetical protein